MMLTFLSRSFLFRILLIGILFWNNAIAIAQTWEPDSYAGKRCGLLLFRDVDIQENKVSFTCDIANSGSEPLKLNGKPKDIAGLVFSEDGSLSAAGLDVYKDLVAATVAKSSISMKPGAFLQNKRFTFKKEDVQLFALPAASVQSQPSYPVQPSEFFFSDTLNGCPDVIIDSMWIVQTKRSSILVKVRIRNIGTGPAKIYPVNAKEKGTGLSFYLGNTPTISRSSLFIHGDHLSEGLNDSQGVLLAGHDFEQLVKVPLSRRAQYLTTLLCRIDTFQYIEECDETNNQSALLFP
jgi:hypothetical protein